MYNTKYECRYHKEDVFLETDEVTNEEKDYIRNVLYQEDFLNIFNFDLNADFDNTFTDEIFTELYKKLSSFTKLRECMKKVSEKIIFQNIEHYGLCFLYSYDYMYLTHKCVSCYLETGTDDNETIRLLNEMIEQIK